MENKVCKYTITTIDNRRLSIIVFSLFFSWLLAFPFEGRTLYALADYHNISADFYIFGSMAANFAGLLICGLFAKNMQIAKMLILFSIAFCVVVSIVFFFPPSYLCTVLLLLSTFLVGCCVAAWGFYFKHFTPKDERIKTMAEGLICSNILMILINITAIYISPHAGVGFSVIILITAFLFACKLPQNDEVSDNTVLKKQTEHIDITRPLIFLCLFIVVITINSGLMYHVQRPAFAHLEWLTSWYWAVPYIVALIIMRNLPRRANRAYILYIAIAMIGFSFIAFLMLEHSWTSYLVVNTLMLGACGVYDLFWWSILGEMLELDKNPAKIMGIGLSANVLGVLLGGLIGNSITSTSGQNQSSTMLALGIVCITLVMLPPLHELLTTFLKNHAYLTAISEMPHQEYTSMIRGITAAEKLTERESEIADLLLKGKTYRMIAGELHVSENTVKTHVKNIYSKAGVQSRTELINLFIDIRKPFK